MKKLFTIAAVVLLGHIAGASHVSAQENSALPTEAPKGRKVAEFLTPDGRFDLEAARGSGYQGPLDIEGFQSTIDSATGRPVFHPLVTIATADHPDDIYWDNSISPCVSGVDGPVYAATVYDGQLVVGGSFQAAGCVIANYIASWDGTAWSPLGSGMDSVVWALTMYDGKLIAGGNFTIAGSKVSAYLAQWTKNQNNCCVGRVGNANGVGTYPNEVTISDIQLLVFAKFISSLPCEQNLHCLTEADVNQSGGADPACKDITISDIQTLVNHLFIAGPANAPLKDCL